MGDAYGDASVLAALRSLQADLPGMVSAYGNSADFWRAFCERASLIEDMAGADGWIHVNDQLDAMLEDAGIDAGGWSDVFDA